MRRDEQSTHLDRDPSDRLIDRSLRRDPVLWRRASVGQRSRKGTVVPHVIISPCLFHGLGANFECVQEGSEVFSRDFANSRGVGSRAHESVISPARTSLEGTLSIRITMAVMLSNPPRRLASATSSATRSAGALLLCNTR